MSSLALMKDIVDDSECGEPLFAGISMKLEELTARGWSVAQETLTADETYIRP